MRLAAGLKSSSSSVGRFLLRPSAMSAFGGASNRAQMSTSNERVITAPEEELVFPYAFMNTDKDLLDRVKQPEAAESSSKKVDPKNAVVLAEIEQMLDAKHESQLHSHFKELYTRYLESLAAIDSDPTNLEEMCEPSFFRKLNKGWTELKDQNARELTLLNAEPSIFKLNLISYSTHFNGYLDRDIDVKSRNQLSSTNGLNYRYTCRWPYKNFIEQTTQFVVRVETDLKLNLSMEEDSGVNDMIPADDEALVKQAEVHFIMFEGLINKHDMGIFGFFKMLWKSTKLEIFPQDGRWQVSDFDHFMRGNPHDIEGMKAAFGEVPKPPTPPPAEDAKQ